MVDDLSSAIIELGALRTAVQRFINHKRCLITGYADDAVFHFNSIL